MNVVFALPGNTFNKDFFTNWLIFMGFLKKQGIQPIISNEGGSNVSITREMCLSVPDKNFDDRYGVLPFEGKIDYDYIMWIDSDIYFKPEHFMKLLSRDKDIVAGLYKKDATHYNASVFPVELGENMLCLEDKDIKGEDLIEARGVGLGFTLVKKGVFEKIARPWFATTMAAYAGSEHFVSEDIYFCLKAIECGFKIWIDPTVKVGHMKLRAI